MSAVLLALFVIGATEHARPRQGVKVRIDSDEVQVVSSIRELKNNITWDEASMQELLGTIGTVVHEGNGYVGVIHKDQRVFGWPLGVVFPVSVPRKSHVLGHIVNAVEANHPPEFTLNPARPTVIMHEDQGELQNGDYWLCGVSDCNGDDQDLLFRFFNGVPQLPNPDPCLVNGGVPRVTPPSPDNDPDTYFDRGPLATRRLMNVAPIQNCPGGGAGVGCGGGGRQWPEDPAGNRVPNTCVGIEEPSCYNTNDGGGMCQGCAAAEVQGRYWCKWPSTLQTNPISPALPNIGGGPRCAGVPQRCPACVKMGMPPAATVDAASQCNVRCWDDTRSGGAHARLEADPSENHWGWVCYDVRAEDDGIPYVLPGSCNCQPGCSTRPCDESPSVRACIYIEPVNDCPTFKVQGDATILEDSATCTGSPVGTCNELAAGGGVVAAPGCLNNLGTCCCPRHAAGCILNDWIYDINQGGWNEHPYQSVYFDVTVNRPELFLDAASVPCVEFVPRTGQCGRASDAAFNAPDFVARDVNFVLKPNACGKVTFTVTARDDGGESNAGCFISQTKSFVLTIKPVNDPPTFLPGPLQGDPLTVDEDSGPFRYAGWATDITPGPGECEKDQILTFTIDCADKSLFSTQPTIDPLTGDLSFTPAPHMFTSTKNPSCVTCSVVLKDDGGTNDGGVDTANPPTQICITINSINDPPSYRPAGDVVVCEDAPYDGQWALDLCIGGLSPSLCADNELLPPENQGFTFTLGAYDTSLFTAGGQPQVDATGKLTFTPAPGVSGTTEVAVTLNDGGPLPNSRTDKLVITVVDVNDPPTVVLGGQANEYVTQGVECTTGSGGVPLLGNGVVSTVLNVCQQTCDTTPTCECFTMDAAGCRLRTACVQSSCAASTTVTTYFKSLPLVEVNEDSGRTCIPSFATGITAGLNEPSQSTSITLVTTPQTLFSEQPKLTKTSTTDAELCFTPELNANGEAFVEVTVLDNGGTSSEHNCGGDDSTVRRFKIKVNPTNDPPQVSPGDNVAVCEDVGPVTLPAWGALSDIDAGDQLTVVATATNPTLFAVQPSLSDTGALSFTPAPDAYGTSEVTFAVTDKAGVTTVTPPTTITVKPSNDQPSFTVLNDRFSATSCQLSDPASACKWTSPLPAITSPSPGTGEASQHITSITVTPDPRFSNLFVSNPVVDLATGVMSFELKPGEDTGGAYIPITITVVDDGTNGVGCSGVSTFSNDILLRVGEAGRQPSFIKGGDVTIVEDSGKHTVIQWAVGIDYGTGGVGLPGFSCVAANASLVTISGVQIDAITGTLTLTPADDRYGSTTVTCTLNNGAPMDCCGSDTFTLTVLPKNDEPTFTLSLPSVTVVDNKGEQTIPGLISTSHVGRYEEGTQTISYIVTPADPEYLEGHAAQSSSRRATIDPLTGDLKLTPIPGKTGSTTLSITAVDTGGTARQGDDTSKPRQIVLNVVHGNRNPNLLCGGDVVVDEDGCFTGGSDRQTHIDWATAVTAGDATEDQSEGLTAVFSNYNQAAFLHQPTLAIPVTPRRSPSTASLSYCVAADFSGSIPLTLQLEDAAGGVSQTCVFTIQVTEVNDPPVLVLATSTVSSLEDAGLVRVDGWATTSAGPPLESSQVVGVSVIVKESDKKLFSAQPIVTGGALVYQSAANSSGSVAVEVCAEDNGGGSSRTCRPITINITPVNDRPHFTVLTERLTLPEDSPPQRVRDWAHTFITGPSDEHMQQLLSLTTSTDKPDMFLELPQVDMATGDLTFAVKPNAFGVASVNIVLKDNGGTDYGGQDSFTRVLILDVTPSNDPPTFQLSRTEVRVLEDTGRHVLQNTVVQVTAGEYEEQPVTFTVKTKQNGVLVGNPSFVSQPVITTEGHLEFTLTPDQYGSYSLEIIASDGIDSTAPVVLALEVLGVNDRPGMTIVTNAVTVLQDSGVNVLQVARDATSGPANEGTQSVGYVVTVPEASLFEGTVAVTTDGMLHIKPASGKSGTTQIQLRAKDDGGTTNGGYDTSGTTLITVTVTPTTQALSLSTLGDVTINEDNGFTTLVGHLYDIPDGAIVSVLSSNPQLTGAPVVASIQNGKADVSFTPAADRNGAAVFMVTAVKNNETASASFTVNVLPINDKPQFTISDSVIVSMEDQGAVVVDDWVTNLSPGNNEASQTLSVNIVCANSEVLFAVPPTLVTTGTTGDLSYRTQPNKYGDSECTITTTDKVCDSCPFLSAQHMFRIAITPVNDPPSFTPVVRGIALYSNVVWQRQWAMEISPGPEETTQSVMFDVKEPAVRMAQAVGQFLLSAPRVGSDGVMEVFPRQGTSGEGLFTVAARDSEGMVSQDVLLLVMVVDSRDSPNPTVVVGVEEGAVVGTAWENQLAASIDKGMGTVKVMGKTQVPSGVDVQVTLMDDADLQGLNALLGIVTDPVKEQTRKSLQIRSVNEGTAEVPLRYVPGNTTAATPREVPVLCVGRNLADCVAPCVVSSGVCKDTVEQTSSDDSGALSPMVIAAIVIASLAVLVVLGFTAAWIARSGSASNKEPPQQIEIEGEPTLHQEESGQPSNPLSTVFPNTPNGQPNEAFHSN